MRSVLSFSAIVMLCAATHAAAQRPFEGAIVYDVVAGDKQMQMTVTTRGTKVRRDLATPDAPEVSRGNYQILDFKTGDATMVFPAMKRYMVLKVDRLRDAPSEVPGDPAADVVATGRTETIAGSRCTVFTMKSVPGSEWCITSAGVKNDSDLAALMNDSPAAGGAMPGLLRGFLRGTIVLRARMVDRNGGVMTMLANKIDRATPPSLLFEMPADFQEFKNPSMP